MNLESADLVYIHWVDSHGPNHSKWYNIDDMADKCELLHIDSVGWVVAENKDAITIVPHKYGLQATEIIMQGQSDMTIPKCSIKKKKILCKGRPK